MAILQAEDINDIVNGTLRKLNKGKLRQIAQALQRYPVMKTWFRKDRIVLGDGYGIQHDLLDKLDETAADHVALFEEDNVAVPDVLSQLRVDWVHARTQWSYDVREPSMNRGESKIVDVVRARETAAMIKLADKLEAAAWSVPSASNRKTPYGIPYYVVYNSTDGHEGLAPTGFTTVANINPTNNTKWRNYSATYVNVTYDDIVKLMRTAHRKCGFTPPVEGQSPHKMPRYRIYMDETTISDFEDVSRQQNDNLGPDVAKMDDTSVFKKIPLVWIPYLDDNMTSGSNPVYMIDHACFYPAVLGGHFFRRTGPQTSANSHNVKEVFRDITYQYVCIDRRPQAVIAKSDPMA